jgi:hypothetical protein
MEKPSKYAVMDLAEWLTREFAVRDIPQQAAPAYTEETPAPAPVTARKRRPAPYMATMEELAELDRIASPSERVTRARFFRDRHAREEESKAKK